MTAPENPFRVVAYPDGYLGGTDVVLARKLDEVTVEYVCDNDHGRATQTVDQDCDLRNGVALALSWQDRGRVTEADAPLQPGEYHPRIWRNGIPPSERSPDEDSWVDPKLNPHLAPVLDAAEFDALRAHIVATHRIQQHVAEVFDAVTPCEANASAFGGAIRQVILLAAIEVESMFTQAFAANRDPSDPSDRSDFTDWKQLFAPMRLDEWRAKLPAYPAWTSEIRPFALGSGTSLPWWTAYNKAKHDPSEIPRANLRNMISAYAAARVLLEAQFGPPVPHMLTHAGLAGLEITARPAWTPTELYFSSLSGNGGYVAVPLRLRSRRPSADAQALRVAALEFLKEEHPEVVPDDDGAVHVGALKEDGTVIGLGGVAYLLRVRDRESARVFIVELDRAAELVQIRTQS